ncbi:MAG: hypothetical protein WBQ18_10885 [Solirubrobacteraceae bacterium]
MSVMTRRAVPLVTLILTALLLAGCGGSAVSRSDVIARGNALCAAALRQIRTLAPPTTAPASLTAMSSYLHQIVPIVEKEIAGLRKLPVPDKGQRLFNSYIRSVTVTAADYRTLEHAAQAGDQTGVDAALSALSTSSASSLAAAYGFGQCATAAGTAVA